MISINLVPDIKQQAIKAHRVEAKVIAMSIFIGIVAVAIVALLAVYIFTVQTVRSGMADQAIKDGIAKLEKVKDLSKTLTIQNQLTKLPILNGSKNITSRAFDVISAIIPPEPNSVQVSNMSVDTTTQTITLEAQASNSYAAAEVFKKTIGNTKLKYTDDSDQKQEIPLASNINISNTSYGADSSGAKVLRFTLSFTYTPELMAISSKSISIIVSNGGNATDSYLGVPKTIFVDAATDIKEGN